MAEPTAGGDMDWMRRGACQGMSLQVFFPEDEITGRARAAEIDKAKEVCNRCPVKTQCLAWALSHRERFGVWGGMSESEREALRRRKGDEQTLNDETPHEETVDRLVAGEEVPEASRVDIAHAAARLHRQHWSASAIARQLGCDHTQVTLWAKRIERGESPINLGWLARQRRIDEQRRLNPEDDGRNEAVIRVLMEGAEIPDADRVDIAHALVRLWKEGRGSVRGLALRFGVGEHAARGWTYRVTAGLPPIDPVWADQYRARRARLAAAS